MPNDCLNNQLCATPGMNQYKTLQNISHLSFSKVLKFLSIKQVESFV